MYFSYRIRLKLYFKINLIINNMSFRLRPVSRNVLIIPDRCKKNSAFLLLLGQKCCVRLKNVYPFDRGNEMEYIDWLFPIFDTFIHEKNDNDIPVKVTLGVCGGGISGQESIYHKNVQLIIDSF
jgi:hypothetical protein